MSGHPYQNILLLLQSTSHVVTHSLIFLSASPLWASEVALVVKNLAADAGMQETRAQSLGWEDPLE